jgi:hypothetical protein
MALEAHLEPVAALVRMGWTLKADMPRKPVSIIRLTVGRCKLQALAVGRAEPDVHMLK